MNQCYDLVVEGNHHPVCEHTELRLDVHYPQVPGPRIMCVETLVCLRCGRHTALVTATATAETG